MKNCTTFNLSLFRTSSITDLNDLKFVKIISVMLLFQNSFSFITQCFCLQIQWMWYVSCGAVNLILKRQNTRWVTTTNYEPSVLNGLARGTPVCLKFKSFFSLGELLWSSRLKGPCEICRAVCDEPLILCAFHSYNEIFSRNCGQSLKCTC